MGDTAVTKNIEFDDWVKENFVFVTEQGEGLVSVCIKEKLFGSVVIRRIPFLFPDCDDALVRLKNYFDYKNIGKIGGSMTREQRLAMALLKSRPFDRLDCCVECGNEDHEKHIDGCSLELARVEAKQVVDEMGSVIKKTCNLHDDCDSAPRGSDHCRDECCEDCFGN